MNPLKKNLVETLPGLPEMILERVGFLLGRSVLKIQEISGEALKPFGITSKQLGILLVIKEKGEQPQQEIGKCMHVDRTTMVQLIDGLEKLGMVERKENSEDRRAYSMALTAKGRDILPKAMQAALTAEKEFLQGLASKDQKELVRILKQLVLHHFAPKSKEA